MKINLQGFFYGFALVLLSATFAQADSVVRIEYVTMNEGPGLNGGGSGTYDLIQSEAPSGGWTFTVTPGAPLTGANAITPPAAIFNDPRAVYAKATARIQVLSGMVAVLNDSSVTVSASKARIVIAGDDHFIPLKPGEKLSITDLSSLLTTNKNAGLTDSQLRASPVPVTQASTVSSGYHLVAAAGTNAASIKNSSGRVIGWFLANTVASWRYVKLHNISGSPTAGSGVVRTIGIPPNGVAALANDLGVNFSNGIGVTVTGGAADTDTTGVAANDVVGDVFYQ